MAAPLYLRIRAELEEQIRSGVLPPGARLPTEAQLCEQHGFSRATAHRVLYELSQAGLVVRHRRRGTFVAGTARQENLLRFINPQASGPAIPGPHEVLSAVVVPAADAEVDLPGIPGENPVVQMVRRKFDHNDTPIAIERAAIPFALAPRLLEEDLEHLTSVVYFRRIGVPIATMRVYLDPLVLDDHTAELLRSPPGQPVLARRRLTWLANGDLAEAVNTVTRPGTMEFFVEQSLPTE
ncbi:MAG: GntR family transcriptional regulator [Pseudonocardia sp.]|nr:GntR family transcriptional regulator [Pseudonocardia sp.]